MRSAWITSRDVALHLRVLEADRPAPTVVFLHGMTVWSDFYARLLPGVDFLAALRDEGLTVVAPDLPGHGLSEGRRGHLLFRDALTAVSEAVSFAIERFGGPVGLAGSSLGGILAFYAALEDERVGAVACHNVADLRDVGPWLRRPRQRALAALVEEGRWLADRAPLVRLPAGLAFARGDVFEDPDGMRRWRRFPRTVWWYTAASLVSIFFTPEDKPAVEAMTRPVLVATGDEDRIFPLVAQERVVRRLEGPSELLALPGAGHMLPLEHMGATAPAFGEWLRKML